MSQPYPVSPATAEGTRTAGSAQLEQQMRSRISWLYWIAGLSVINSFLSLGGGGIQFIFGLGATQVIDAIVGGVAQQANPNAATIVRIVGIGMSFACAGVFVLFGYLAMRRSAAAAIVGIVLYAADGLLLLLFEDWLGVVFHGFVLAMLVGGVQSILQLRRMERAAAVAAYPGGPAQPPWPQQQASWPQQQQAWPQQQPPSPPGQG